MSIQPKLNTVNGTTATQGACCGTFGGPSRLEIARARVASTEAAALALLRIGSNTNPFAIRGIANALRKADAELEAATVSDQLERSLDLMAAKGYVVEGFDRRAWSVDTVTEEAPDGTIRGVGYAEAFVPMCRSKRLRHNLLPMARPLRDRTGGAR